MKQILLALIVATLCVPAAYAQQPEGKKELTDQQKRMQTCNADAKKRQFKDKEERQAFMSSCLKGETTGMTRQQLKMAECNKDASAKGMKGDERKKFMSECLKG
jgi:psiF repeat